MEVIRSLVRSRRVSGILGLKNKDGLKVRRNGGLVTSNYIMGSVCGGLECVGGRLD